MQKKNKPLLIFGNGGLASITYDFIKRDGNFDLFGFIVDKGHQASNTFLGCPNFSFEDIESNVNPRDYAMLLPIGPHKRNKIREERYVDSSAKGFEITSFISGSATIRIDVNLHSNCNIHDGAIIQPFSKVGENVFIRSGVNISHHCEIGDHVFISNGVILGGNVRVGDHAFLGLGAIVKDGVSIGRNCIIGAGAVLVRDADEGGTYFGNPARKIPSSET